MLPKIENPPKNRTLEHTSINDPPFSTTSRSRIRYFSNRGRLISPVEKMGALWVPWLLAQHPYSKGPGISKPTGQAQASGLSTLAYRPGPSILTQAGIRTTTRIMARGLSDHSKSLRDLLPKHILFYPATVSKNMARQ